jgi:hypothetical protein
MAVFTCKNGAKDGFSYFIELLRRLADKARQRPARAQAKRRKTQLARGNFILTSPEGIAPEFSSTRAG